MRLRTWQKDGVFFCGGMLVSLSVFGIFFYVTQKNADTRVVSQANFDNALLGSDERRELLVGSVGSDVVELHDNLIAHGIAQGDVFSDEKYFGEKTQYYVMLFQLTHDIVPSGVVNQETWSALAQAPQKEKYGYQRVPIDQGVHNMNLFYSPYVTKKAYFTFNIDNQRDDLDQYLVLLEKYNAHGTFFFTQNGIYNSQKTVQRVHAAQHSVGILLEDHWDFSSVTYNELVTNLTSSVQAVSAITRRSPWCARPSYSMLMSVAQNKLAQLPMTMMYWDVDPQNQHHISSDAIADHVVSYTQPGEVVLFHIDDRSDDTTLVALEKILKKMRDDRWEFHSLSCM